MRGVGMETKVDGGFEDMQSIKEMFVGAYTTMYMEEW